MSDDPPEEVSDLAGRPAGAEREDPYAGTDTAELPHWWRRAVEEHEVYDLRAYRPPRFADGVLKREVVEHLEAELGISLRLVCYDPQTGPWHVLVDGVSAGTLDRRRSVDGYTVFEVESEAFERLVRDALADGHAADAPGED